MDRPEIKDAIEKLRADVWNYEISGTDNTNTNLNKFEIKSSLYKFDDEVLKDKITKYIASVDKLVSETGYTANLKKKTEEEQAAKEAKAAETKARDEELRANGPEAGSVYEFINQIKESYGAAVAAKAFGAALVRGNEYDFGIALQGMPSDVQSIYKKAIKDAKDSIK